jgi:hypothetical protein
MALRAYPVILREHYEDLRSLLPDLPESYEKWLEDVKNKKGDGLPSIPKACVRRLISGIRYHRRWREFQNIL